MRDGFIAREDWTGSPDVLVRSETGEKLHIAACPHIGGGIRAADQADSAAFELCSWCDKELSGVGRTYYGDLDSAMRAFKTYAGTDRLIKAHPAAVEFDEVWIPNSQSYVALGLGGKAVAWFCKTYVAPAADQVIELPGFRPGPGAGAAVVERVGDVCEIHFVARSVTGVCEACE